MREFEGKSIVVTGANRGIARACVKAFAAEGADIFAIVRSPIRFEDERKYTEDRFHVNIRSIQAEFTDEKAVKNAAREILATKEKIYVLMQLLMAETILNIRPVRRL